MKSMMFVQRTLSRCSRPPVNVSGRTEKKEPRWQKLNSWAFNGAMTIVVVSTFQTRNMLAADRRPSPQLGV